MVAAERHVQLGRAALWVGDGTGARAQFELGDLTPEVFEGLAAASYVLFEYPRAIAEFERAYAGYRQQGDGSGSARVARTFRLHVRTTAGDWAVASGWIARAKTLLRSADVERAGMGGADRGHVRGGMRHEGGRLPDRDPDRADDGGPHLTFAAMAYLGASVVHGDRSEEGLSLLDGTLAAVAGGEVEDFILIEEISASCSPPGHRPSPFLRSLDGWSDLVCSPGPRLRCCWGGGRHRGGSSRSTPPGASRRLVHGWPSRADLGVAHLLAAGPRRH